MWVKNSVTLVKKHYVCLFFFLLVFWSSIEITLLLRNQSYSFNGLNLIKNLVSVNMRHACTQLRAWKLLPISVKTAENTLGNKVLNSSLCSFVSGQQFFPFNAYMNRNVFYFVDCACTCTGFISCEVSLCHYCNNFDLDKTVFSHTWRWRMK